MTTPATAPNTRPPASKAERFVADLKRDRASWARRCYRIRDKLGLIRALTFNEVQRDIYADERRQLQANGQVRQYILKGRQGGVSTYEQAANLHDIWRRPGFDALTLAHTREDTDMLFEITQRAVEHFPRALMPALGASETREISFPGLDTHFYTRTAGAKRSGRGMTLRRVHGSEFAFWDDPEGTLGALTPALVPFGSTVALETTASGFDTPPHNFWREAKARGYTPLFFPWWRCDRAHYRLPLLEPDELGKLEDDEQLLATNHGVSLEEIKWRRAKIAEMLRAKFLTEYPEDEESCWAAEGGMFYDAELLKALMLNAPTPIETHLGGALQIFHYLPDAQRRGVGPNPEQIIIGADTAEGGGGDRSTFVARGRKTWRLYATYQDNRVTPKDFAGILNTWGRKLGMAFLVPEKNMHGITVIRHLRDDHAYPTSHIYHRVPLDQEYEETAERIGWVTSAQTQPLLLDAGTELLVAARDGHASIPSKEALRDAFGVRRDKNGKISLTGKDMLVGEALAWHGRSAPMYEPLIGRAR